MSVETIRRCDECGASIRKDGQHGTLARFGRNEDGNPEILRAIEFDLCQPCAETLMEHLPEEVRRAFK